jgi:hypothetical protein
MNINIVQQQQNDEFKMFAISTVWKKDDYLQFILKNHLTALYAKSEDEALGKTINELKDTTYKNFTFNSYVILNISDWLKKGEEKKNL